MAIFCHSPPDSSTPRLEALAERSDRSARASGDDLVGQAAAGGIGDAFAVLTRLDPADRDILRRREVVAHEVLEDDADIAAQLVERRSRCKSMAVEQDAALVRIVKPDKKLDHRGLAGTVLADQRQHLAGRSVKSRWRTAQRSASGYRKPTSSNTEPSRIGTGKARGCGGRDDLRPDGEEREQVVEIERLAGDLREADQQILEQIAQAPEGGRRGR